MSDRILASKIHIRLMSIIAVVTVLSVLVFCYSLQVKYTELHEMWLEVSELEKQQTTALATISKGFGYGGFIHHFKNYVLRKDEKYLTQAEASLSLTYEGIEDYLDSSFLDISSREKMLVFKKTVDKYAKKLALVQTLVAAGLSSEEIDSQVYVDDSHALTAIELLFSKIESSTTAAQATAIHAYSSKMDIIIIAEIAMLLLIAFVLIFFIRQSKQLSTSYQQLKTLLNAAPSAIIQADVDGNIVLFNEKALETFQYNDAEFSRLSIEDLIPEAYRKRHISHRKHYHDKTSNATMNSRSAEFTALRKNGEIFPVSVSLATFSSGSDSGSISLLVDLTAEKELVAAAMEDPLTHLGNRRSAEAFFDKAIQLGKRQNDAVSVVMFDIDLFKNVNDTYGHPEGDRVLKKVAAIMKQHVRETDLVARWGGEEFLIVCPSTDKLTANLVAEKIRQLIETEFKQDTIQITVSGGVTSYHDRDTQERVIMRVDKALYQSKATGRNRITVL